MTVPTAMPQVSFNTEIGAIALHTDSLPSLQSVPVMPQAQSVPAVPATPQPVGSRSPIHPFSLPQASGLHFTIPDTATSQAAILRSLSPSPIPLVLSHSPIPSLIPTPMEPFSPSSAQFPNPSTIGVLNALRALSPPALHQFRQVAQPMVGVERLSAQWHDPRESEAPRPYTPDLSPPMFSPDSGLDIESDLRASPDLLIAGFDHVRTPSEAAWSDTTDSEEEMKRAMHPLSPWKLRPESPIPTPKVLQLGSSHDLGVKTEARIAPYWRKHESTFGFHKFLDKYWEVGYSAKQLCKMFGTLPDCIAVELEKGLIALQVLQNANQQSLQQKFMAALMKGDESLASASEPQINWDVDLQTVAMTRPGVAYICYEWDPDTGLRQSVQANSELMTLLDMHMEELLARVANQDTPIPHSDVEFLMTIVDDLRPIPSAVTYSRLARWSGGQLTDALLVRRETRRTCDKLGRLARVEHIVERVSPEEYDKANPSRRRGDLLSIGDTRSGCEVLSAAFRDHLFNENLSHLSQSVEGQVIIRKIAQSIKNCYAQMVAMADHVQKQAQAAAAQTSSSCVKASVPSVPLPPHPSIRRIPTGESSDMLLA
mmetsp:Transcript_25637/g.40179  ORF Transcript_25637/g.40179 Transcript_25637/m.40179 type:complete len:598 (-) Transcript_25637:973-2766(-)